MKGTHGLNCPLFGALATHLGRDKEGDAELDVAQPGHYLVRELASTKGG